MEKSILERLYAGEIYPAEDICVNNPEYHKLNDELADKKERFVKMLTDNNIPIFTNIEDLHYKITNLYGYEGFAQGFKLAVSLMAESLNGTATLIQNGDEVPVK